MQGWGLGGFSLTGVIFRAWCLGLEFGPYTSGPFWGSGSGFYQQVCEL